MTYTTEFTSPVDLWTYRFLFQLQIRNGVIEVSNELISSERCYLLSVNPPQTEMMHARDICAQEAHLHFQELLLNAFNKKP